MTDSFATPPTLTQVDGKTAPELPQAWHAIALTTPYSGGQLFAVEVWYDWSIQAMLVSAVGVDTGSIDLLFVKDQFFILDPSSAEIWGPFPSPQAVPAPDWLAARDMNCQGKGQLLTAECDWWVGYTPNANGLDPYNPKPKNPPVEVCNWVWARSDTGYPFRFFFNNANNPYAFPVLGGFAMTHFTLFEAETSDTLQKAMDRRAHAGKTEAPTWDGVGLDPLLDAARSLSPDFGAQVQPGGAGRLIAGLKPAPVDAPIPSWPDRLCITGYTLPTAKQQMFNAAALPIRVFYEWPKSRMLTRASMNDKSWGENTTYTDMILDDEITYILLKAPGKKPICGPPQCVGLPYKDWAKRDNGQPRAVIENNPVLCPGKTINVTVAPNPPTRHFWLWYTQDMDGVMFIEVPQKGNVGLVVTDYYSFDQDPPEFPDAAFDVPTACVNSSRKACNK